MTNSLPAEVTLIRTRSSSKADNHEPRQIIQLNIVENVTKELLKSLRNNEQVRLKLGKKPLVQYGTRSITLNHNEETFPSEIFAGTLNEREPMYFSGKLSHTLEVQKAKEDTAGTDEALMALANSLKSMQELKASNEASLVRGREPSKRDQKLPALSNTRFLGSQPSSPFLSAGRSPGFGPTSVPSLPSLASRDKLRLDAMKIPIVHLLAIGPMTTDSIAKMLNASKDECEKVLDKVAREVNGQRELKDKLYKDLDVWKFPYQSNEDRQQAIDRAVHAYDRIRVERNDSLWQLLLPKDKRGKGIVLSRLNLFVKKSAPPKPVISTEKDVKPDVSDKEGKTRKPKVVNNISTGRKSDGGPPKSKIIKATGKTVPRSSKQDSNPKSSERIENSDEEAGLLKRTSVRTAPSISQVKDKESERKILATKAQGHKSRPSDSSASSDADKSRKVAERELVAPRSRTDNISKKGSRPRTVSSPQKPSPLGSSPPTNSTDADDSSKASTQSSAPSSPPSSGNDVPLAQQRRVFSPVGGSRVKAQQASPPKRKAERSDDERPGKKHQVNGDKLNSLPKALMSQLQQPTPERRSSGSSVSSPGKSRLARQDVIAEAKSFTSYYGRYRDLHERLSRLSSKDRSDGDLERLWSMHKRLGEMKAEIWADWDKVGGG